MSNPLQCVERLCVEHPITTKIVFSPGRQLGYNASNALLPHLGSWANLHFQTPAEYALGICGPALTASGKRRISFDLPPFIILHLLSSSESLKSDLLGNDVRLSPGVVSSLERSIVAIRQAGIDPESLRGDSIRRNALAELAIIYSRFLENKDLFDDPSLLTNVPTSPEAAADPAVVFSTIEYDTFSTIEKKYINTLLPNGQRESDQQESVTTAAIPSVRYANGSRAESFGVIEEILDAGFPLDSVEIAYTAEKPYLRDLANIEAWLPGSLSFANGTPVVMAAPGRSVSSFLKWLISGCRASIMVDLLRTGDISFKALNISGIRPDFVAEQLIRFRAGNDWKDLNRISRIVQRKFEPREVPSNAQPSLFDSPAGDNKGTGFKLVVDNLTSLVPREPSISLAGLSSLAIGYLERFAPVRIESDAVARDSLLERFKTLGSFDLEIPTRQGLELLRQLVLSHKVSASVALPGKINVVPLEKAGMSGRQHVFVLGMDDETYPGNDSSSFFKNLVDLDETADSGSLRHTRERAVKRLLSITGIDLVFVSQRTDPADGSEVHPAPIVRLYEKDDQGITYHRHGQSSLAVRPSFGLASQIGVADYQRLVESTFPWLATGRNALSARQSDVLTSYDGVLDEPTPELDLSDSSNVISASSMEKLSGCSYRYFLQKVLNVRIPESPPDEFSWLSSLQKGRLLHDLLFHYLEEIRTGQGDSEIDRDRLLKILDKLIESHKQENPPHNAAGYEADREALVLAAEIFLSAEGPISAEDLFALELRFGFAHDETAWTDYPVRIPIGDEVVLHMRGAIDRVDRYKDGYRIWDYKSGSLFNFDEVPLNDDLRHMQWALYAFALEELLAAKGDRGRVRKSGYFFISERGNGQMISAEPPARSVVGQRLAPLTTLVKSGTFVHAHRDRTECRFCDYNPVCGGEVVLASDIKTVEAETERQAVAKENARQWLTV